MKKQYKHIVFDFDGTLADSSVLLTEILRTLSERHGLKDISYADFQNYRALPMGKKARLLPLLVKLKPEITELYGHGVMGLEFIPGMQATLAALRGRGFALAVLTSNDAGNITRFLEARSLPFTLPVISSRGFFGKHSTLGRYCREYGCAPADILYIGDELRDVEACAKAGVDIAFVGWGLDAATDLGDLPVAFRLAKPEDLLEMI